MQMWKRLGISLEPPGGSEAAHGADSGGPVKVAEKFWAADFAGQALAPGQPEAQGLADTPTCLGRQVFLATRRV